ncbi:MAG TPA: type II toxin-antitoxin system VapC family toxin [Thermoanaerobaculia bacterium]|nr:type II toxin-antitoxin system VapC family toxin [Thermoanaerobaculia bacterium]
MITLVDSNVILDVVTDDPLWLDWSSDALARAADEATLAINPIIYAEVSVGFAAIEQLEDLLPASDFKRLDLPYESAFLAGKAFLAYRRRGGKRSAPLPDFYIGAHAAISGLRLLTRDPQRYRTYFPSIDIIAPSR